MSRHTQSAKAFVAANLRRHRQHMNIDAGGIEVGSERHLVAVPEVRDEVSVREFGPLTEELHALADCT